MVYTIDGYDPRLTFRTREEALVTFCWDRRAIHDPSDGPIGWLMKDKKYVGTIFYDKTHKKFVYKGYYGKNAHKELWIDEESGKLTKTIPKRLSKSKSTMYYVHKATDKKKRK